MGSVQYGRSIVPVIVVILVGAVAPEIAGGQTLRSTNPNFAKYYSVIQDAGPTYTFGPNSPYGGWAITVHAAADFLGLGTPQILLGGLGLNQGVWQQAPVRLLVNRGNGTYADGSSAMSNPPLAYFTGAAAVADFNGDGRPDVYLGNNGIDGPPESGELNALLLSASGGQLQNASSGLPAPPGATTALATAPLRGGTAPDIFVGTICCGSKPYLLLNDGKGNFTMDSSRLPAELQTFVYSSAALIDVNQDGFPDLALGFFDSGTEVNKIYLNDGHGSFANSTPIVLPPGCFDSSPGGTSTLSMAVADLRGTGEQDLIINEVGSGYLTSCIQILVNDGTGRFTDQTAARAGNSLALANNSGTWYTWTHVADVNGDGYPDLVVTPGFLAPSAPNIVLLNDGHGFFTSVSPDFFPVYVNPDGSRAEANYMIPVDLDGHGKIGFVQPYFINSGLKFAVYQPIAHLPTPASQLPNLVPVTINSSAVGAPVTVSGSGCFPGTYPTPAKLFWPSNTSCTISFPSGPFYVSDPRSGSAYSSNQRYVFSSTTIGGSAAVSANPRTTNSGTAPITINADLMPAPVSPTPQSSVLQFQTGGQAAFATPISVGPDLTMETWVLLTAPAPVAYLMGKPTNPDGDPFANYVIALDASGTHLSFIESTGQPGSAVHVTAPAPTPMNTWTHVAAVVSSGTLYLYIDGQLVGSAKNKGPIAGQNVPFCLGGSVPDGRTIERSFQGSMRQARLWSRALSAAEIQTSATAGLAGTETGLLADWPLDDANGQTARNLVPGAPALTLLGSPRWTVPSGSSGLPNVTGVANVGGVQAVSPGSFVSIYGYLFASLPLLAWDSFIANGQLPAQLDGVTVSIGGKAAYISAVTPGQINVQVPDIPPGSTQVAVQTPTGASAPFTITAQPYAPALFLWPNQQPVATHPDYTPAATNGTFPGLTTMPAKPGDVITLWGTGFGPTTPAVPAGQLPGQNAGAPTLSPVTVTLNDSNVLVIGAALSSFPGLYQVAIQIPASLPDGDYTLVTAVNGISSPASTLRVQN